MRKRLTEKFERVKSAASGNGLRREINEDFKYDKKKLKHLTFVLHCVNVSLGALVSALSRFSKLQGPTISPDGLLGGLGYVMPIKEMKLALHDVVEKLSDIQDSIADEMNNPRWDASENKEVKKVLKEKEEVEEKMEEQEISPQDIVTSAEVLEGGMTKEAEDRFTDAVKDTLVRFNCRTSRGRKD